MTNFNVVFDADSLTRTWVRRVVGYDIEVDVAISLMWQYLAQKATTWYDSLQNPHLLQPRRQ